MNRVAIGFSTYNKPELTRRSLLPLYDGPHALFWADGSASAEALRLLDEYPAVTKLYGNVCGGSGAAIVFLLSAMLDAPCYGHPPDKTLNPGWYDYIGLCESDVLLDPTWFEPTMDLFERGKQDGLTVGSVSARCYEDRILVQRDGYAVVHNTGAGMIIFTRAAAQLVLDQYRTQKTTENRAIFSQLSGVDIARYWAFRGSDNWLVADWRWDALLASQGYASLALTPSPVEMIGQNPPLAQQGLTLSTGPMGEFDLPDTFKTYRDRLASIRGGQWRLPGSKFYVEMGGFVTTFPHQIASLGGFYEGEWRLKDSQGFGPFAWRAERDAKITIPVFGPCELFIGGGKDGSQVRIVDEQSGYDVRPTLAPEGTQGQVMTVSVPATVGYRHVTVTALMAGATFYGVRTRDPQPVKTEAKFDYSVLPPV